MGLDMYLTRKSYVKNWNHTPEEKRTTVTVKSGGLPRADINPDRVTYIEEEMGYWRKANAIHNWFIDNCSDNGEDDCKPLYVSDEKLQELLDTCIKVLSSLTGAPKEKKLFKIGWGFEGDIMEEYEVIKKEYTQLAEELLPTQSGFFFGGTEYGDYYKDMLEHTINVINDCFEADRIAENLGQYAGEYYYQASW